MPPTRSPLYLERESYRRRRLADAARVLPVAGLVLILLPVLWTRDTGATAFEAVYLFALWAVLVVAAALMSRSLRAQLGRDAPPRTRSGPTPAVTRPGGVQAPAPLTGMSTADGAMSGRPDGSAGDPSAGDRT